MKGSRTSRFKVSGKVLFRFLGEGDRSLVILDYSMLLCTIATLILSRIRFICYRGMSPLLLLLFKTCWMISLLVLGSLEAWYLGTLLKMLCYDRLSCGCWEYSILGADLER